jgi:hypothetical protein
MSAMTSLLLKDDAATPKEWSLFPVTDTPNPLWRASDVALPLEAQPTVELSFENLKSGAVKVSAKLVLPVLETLGASGTSLGYVAPPKVAYAPTIIVTMFTDKRSTATDRANLLKMMIGLLQGATSTTSTGTINQASAGDVYKSSNAPFPYGFTYLFAPF